MKTGVGARKRVRFVERCSHCQGAMLPAERDRFRVYQTCLTCGYTVDWVSPAGTDRSRRKPDLPFANMRLPNRRRRFS